MSFSMCKKHIFTCSTLRNHNRRYVQFDRPILIGDSQSSPIHRISGSGTGKGDGLMILRNSIRPSINNPTKVSPGTCITRQNSNIIIVSRVETRIATPTLTTKPKTLRNQSQIINGGCTSPSNRHSHIRSRRRRHRRPQMKKPAPGSAVLPQRGHHRTGIIPIDHAERNRIRLRPHTCGDGRQHRPHQPNRQRQQTQPSHRLASILRSAGRPVNRPDAKNATPPPNLSNHARPPNSRLNRKNGMHAGTPPGEAGRSANGRVPLRHRLTAERRRVMNRWRGRG